MLVTLVSAVAVAALAVVTGKWMFGPAGPVERLLCLAAALLLLYLSPVPVLIGLGLLAVAVLAHLVLRRRAPAGGASLITSSSEGKP